jgi:hypothetical protein
MKLSALKKLVADMEELTLDRDPDVRFYITRNEAEREAGPKQSAHFIEMEPHANTSLRDCVVVVQYPELIPDVGDFSIPMTLLNVYR